MFSSCTLLCAAVIATANEPLPGWIDNLYGPTGIVTGVMTGIIKSIPCDINAVTDLVPVDMTVNALIAASWDMNVRYSHRNDTHMSPLKTLFFPAALFYI